MSRQDRPNSRAVMAWFEMMFTCCGLGELVASHHGSLGQAAPAMLPLSIWPSIVDMEPLLSRILTKRESSK